MAEMTPEEFSRRLKMAVRTGAIGDGMVRAADRIAVRMDAIAQKRVTGGGSSTRLLNVRTGKLRQSIKWKVKRIRSGVQASIQAGGSAGGAVVKYARIHELGGDITMRRGKALKKPIRIPKRPYLRPGRDAGARIARQVMTEEFRKSLRTVGLGS